LGRLTLFRQDVISVGHAVSPPAAGYLFQEATCARK
jgi:hypothetical protein